MLRHYLSLLADLMSSHTNSDRNTENALFRLFGQVIKDLRYLKKYWSYRHKIFWVFFRAFYFLLQKIQVTRLKQTWNNHFPSGNISGTIYDKKPKLDYKLYT